MRLARTGHRGPTVPAALLVAVVVTACATRGSARPGVDTMRVDEAANGSEVRLAVGQQLELVLGETRTTGYRWNVVSDGAPVCRLERDRYDAPGATPGAPGRHIWIVAAAHAGAAAIELEYRRSFGEGEPARRFTLRVVAQ